MESDTAQGTGSVALLRGENHESTQHSQLEQITSDVTSKEMFVAKEICLSGARETERGSSVTLFAGLSTAEQAAAHQEVLPFLGHTYTVAG